MSDILYEPISIPTVADQLRHFDLTEAQLTTLLQVSTLAGGAATNIFYNYIHQDAPKPMDPNSDLDFWVYDPHIDERGDPERARVLAIFTEHLRGAGYITHTEEKNRAAEKGGFPNTYAASELNAWNATLQKMRGTSDAFLTWAARILVDYEMAFAVQGDTRIICNWWAKEDPMTGATKRIQLIFTSRPIADTLLDFDFPVCRAAVSCSPRGTFKLQWTGQCEKVIRDRVMMVENQPTTYNVTKKDLRAKKYADRYGLTLLSPTGAPVTIPKRYGVDYNSDNEK